MADPGFPAIYWTTAQTLPAICLATEIRSLLNDPLPGLVINNTQLMNFVHRSASIMAREGKCYEEETISFALATDTTEYAYLACGLATNGNVIDYVVDIETLIYTGVVGTTTAEDLPLTTAKALIKIDQRMLNHLDQNTAGAPVYWCDTGKSIRIWPLPTATENTKVCTVLFYRSTNVISDVDAGTNKYVPRHMMEYSIWYALAEAWKRKGRPDISRWFQALFDKLVMYHRQDNLRKPVDSHEDMKVADFTQYQ